MVDRKIPVLPCSTFIPDPDFPLAIRQNTRHGSIDLHAHEFIELVIIRSGRARHFSPGDEYPISSGDVFVVHLDEAHGYRADQDLDLVNILYRPGAFFDNDPALRDLQGFRALFSLDPADRTSHGFGTRLHLSDDARVQVNQLIDSMGRETTTSAPGFRAVVCGLLTQLAVTLSRLYSDTTWHTEAALLEIEPTLQHLRRSFDRDLKLDDLASQAGMSVSTLLRRFRTATGSSPVEFLLRLRLERAREILSTTDRRITDIAFDCGFRDSNYFTRQFKRHTGLSPRAYRRSLRYL
jgi:AraC family L-rhamnose operon transcriptional activator RhaR/AraC family L-rhamnose operon regulatory protein RhaS